MSHCSPGFLAQPAIVYDREFTKAVNSDHGCVEMGSYLSHNRHLLRVCIAAERRTAG
ncbi:hypothetical protein GCM10022421_29930 [Oceanisphaera sediminis]|uniref:Uncharacterized protein n=1 Tax=Oceanisphaera sediminis TaxID=981381 RepID=A0ABP7EIN0_9GAMM